MKQLFRITYRLHGFRQTKYATRKEEAAAIAQAATRLGATEVSIKEIMG
jgi:hypothetical protein